jgi:hypothetical protein
MNNFVSLARSSVNYFFVSDVRHLWNSRISSPKRKAVDSPITRTRLPRIEIILS